MTSILREDFKQGTVDDSPLGAAATTINSTEFANLGVVTGGSGQVRKLILDPAGVNGDPEIVYVTSHIASASAATVERGKEGTVAREHPSGTVWKHGPTAQDFGLQIGEMKMFLGSTSPERWVFARGQELSRTTYAKLFAVLGTTFGVGDGATTFNVPDLQGRFPVGVDGAGSTDYDLGDMGGEETHALTEAELAGHTHTGPSHTHTGPSHTHTGPSHSHGDGTLTANSNGAHDHSIDANPGGGPNPLSNAVIYSPYLSSPDATISGGGSYGVNSDGAHTHTVTGTTAAAGTGATGSSGTGATGASGTGATGSTGSGTAHENRPPFLAVNYIIYAGV